MLADRKFVIALLLAQLISIIVASFSTAAETSVFHAASSGQRALDQGEGGGNPFASALIDILARPRLALGELPDALKALTYDKSRGRMTADVPGSVELRDWPIVPATPGEQRKALVLVISDYTRTGGAKSLPGAKHDAFRVAKALEAAGFSTEIALDLDLTQMKATLSAFGEQSRSADAAIVYTTGHGVEVNGRIYLIPGDYPVKERNGALAARAFPLAGVVHSINAKRINLVFYGGCRDNPFAK